jgi:hypothetical protein
MQSTKRYTALLHYDNVNAMQRKASIIALRLRVTLDEIEPPIWREVIFPRNATLHELHRAIQVLFDWYDYHLYEFNVDGRRFEAPDKEAEGEDSTKARLAALITAPGQVIEYTYDFGDDWRHLIEVTDVSVPASPDRIPHLVDGARRAPPEDCGGAHGYLRLLEIMRIPYEDRDEEDRSFVDWAGADFDPEEFSVSQARHALLLAAAWGSLKRRR